MEEQERTRVMSLEVSFRISRRIPSARAASFSVLPMVEVSEKLKEELKALGLSGDTNVSLRSDGLHINLDSNTNLIEIWASVVWDLHSHTQIL